jgi:CDP-6-deoxy-D-xylo-4-hexulose-3-dehydrase
VNIRSIITDYEYPTAWSGWDGSEQAAIDRVVCSGKFTSGLEVSLFEAEFAAFHGMKHGIMVNSGSSANLIAVAALFESNEPPQHGDTAIVPAMAWSTSYAPIIQHGLEPLICDIGEDWNADPKHIAHITDCSVILACSVLGNPTDETRWAALADDLGAFLICDNCESVGAFTSDNKRTGTQGIGNTFSFYYSHQLSAIEGGMILTNNDDYATACRMLAAHGWTRGLRKPRTLEEEFEFHVFGYNVRPVEMHAAIAREQLKKLPARKTARAKNYDHWIEASCDLPIEHPKLNGDPSLFGIHFAVESNAARKALAPALRGAGIDCRPPIGGSFLCQPYGAPWRSQMTPVADDLHYRGLFLGNAPFPIEDLIDRAVSVMRKVL